MKARKAQMKEVLILMMMESLNWIRMLFSVCGDTKTVRQEVTTDTIGNGTMFRNMQNNTIKTCFKDISQKNQSSPRLTGFNKKPIKHRKRKKRKKKRKKKKTENQEKMVSEYDCKCYRTG